MKKKLLMTLCCVLFFLTSCSNDDHQAKNELSNTSWKLIGFYSIETGELQTAQPEDCDECYTIIFSDGGLLSGKTCSNVFEGRFSVEGNQFAIQGCTSTKVGEMYDGEKFYSSLLSSSRYSVSEKQLRLYYNNGQSYLLFKLR